MITHIFLTLRDFFYKLKIVISEVNDVEWNQGNFYEKAIQARKFKLFLCRKKSLSLFPITNSIGSLVFEPTSQLILEDPRAFEWILPPMLKKIIGKEVSFETYKKQVKFNERHTHVITLSSAMSPEKKL